MQIYHRRLFIEGQAAKESWAHLPAKESAVGLPAALYDALHHLRTPSMPMSSRPGVRQAWALQLAAAIGRVPHAGVLTFKTRCMQAT